MVEILVDLVFPSVLWVSENFLKYVDLNSFSFPVYSVATGFCRPIIKKGCAWIFVEESIPSQIVDVTNFCVEGYFELSAIYFDIEGDLIYLLQFKGRQIIVSSKLAALLNKFINK